MEAAALDAVVADHAEEVVEVVVATLEDQVAVDLVVNLVVADMEEVQVVVVVEV